MKQKNILFLSMICILCWTIVLFWPTYSFATDALSPLDEWIMVDYNISSLQWFAVTIESVLKMLYFLMWPLLVIAGAAMDNSLVYGDALHLTQALRKFWQILRTFANFTIGFLFVWSIVAAFFGYKYKEWTTRIRGLVKKTVIAVLVVNLSRRVMAALIDLSTVSTIAIGGLPLHALEKDQVFNENVYYIKPYININYAQSQESTLDTTNYSLIYGCGSWDVRFYLPCPVNGRKLYPQDCPEDEAFCWYNYKQTFVDARTSHTWVNVENISDDYCIYGQQIIAYVSWANLDICQELQPLIYKWNTEGTEQCTKIHEILTKATGMTWPLFTLFGSILWVAEMGVTTNLWWFVEVTLEMLIKAIFGLALIVPLFVLAIIMIMRVVILWLIITFSPLIWLAIAFDFQDLLKKANEKVSKENILWLIFLPTVATFGISISIIFLSLLINLPKFERSSGIAETNIEQPNNCQNDVATALTQSTKTCEEGGDCTYDLWLISLTITESMRKTGSNIVQVLSRLIINSFGVALMWMIVFMALKTNEFTNSTVDSIKDMSEQFMKNAPIIPIGGGVGVAAFNSMSDRVSNIGNSIKNKQAQKLDFSNTFRDRAMNNAPETKTLRDAYAKSIGQNDQGPYAIWSAPVVAGTDYNDYQPAAKKYAEIAYKNQALQGIRWYDQLQSIDSRDDALKNPAFMHWLHTQQTSGKSGIDSFLDTWDQSTDLRQREKNINQFKQALSTISWQKGTTDILLPDQRIYSWYEYDNKFTLITQNKENPWQNPDIMTYDKISNWKQTNSALTKNDMKALSMLITKWLRATAPQEIKTTVENKIRTVNPWWPLTETEGKFRQTITIDDTPIHVTYQENNSNSAIIGMEVEEKPAS